MKGAALLGRVQLVLSVAALGVIGVGTGLLVASLTLAPGSIDAAAAACGRLLPSPLALAALGSVALLAVAGVVLALGTHSLARRLRSTWRHRCSLRLTGESIQVGSTRCTILAERESLAFCAGLLRPRIYLSRGTVAQLSDRELEAVVAHEHHHLRSRDPLRLLVLQTLADALFFLPVLKVMVNRYAALLELSADQAAIDAVGSRQPIASALLRFADAPRGSVAMAGIAAERVSQLHGDPNVTRWRLPRSAVGGSVGSLALLVLLATSALSYGPPATSLPVLLAQSCMPAMGLALIALAAVAVHRGGSWNIAA